MGSLKRNLVIGIASEIGQNDAGLAVWMLKVHGADVPGRWILVDQRFVLEPESGDRTGA